jgi:hypothetical protein
LSRVEGLRQPEIQDLHGAVGPFLDVRGFQISMDDAQLVSGFEGIGDLARHGNRVGNRQRAALDDIGQRRSLDEFHHEGALFHTVDVRDMGVVQRCERTRLAFESRELLGAMRKLVGENLHGDVAAEPRVARTVDLTHAALAEKADDLVQANARASGEAHGRIIVARTGR